MLIVLPRILSLNFLDQANSYLYFKTILSFPITQTARLGAGQALQQQQQQQLSWVAVPGLQSQQPGNLVLGSRQDQFTGSGKTGQCGRHPCVQKSECLVNST